MKRARAGAGVPLPPGTHTSAQILRATSRASGFTVEQLTGRDLSRPLCGWRHAAMFLVWANHGNEECARVFDGRQVSYAVTKVIQTDSYDKTLDLIREHLVSRKKVSPRALAAAKQELLEIAAALAP